MTHDPEADASQNPQKQPLEHQHQDCNAPEAKSGQACQEQKQPMQLPQDLNYVAQV